MSLIPVERLKKEDHIYKNDDEYHNPKAKKINNSAGILVDLVKSFNLKSGASLNNVLCPVNLLKRFSLLEMYSYISQPKHYLVGLEKLNPEERFLRVCKWILENQSIFPQSGMQDIKPFNPILGEYFEMEFSHGEGVENTKFVAEQTSHHPPITAVYLENKELGFIYEQTQQPMPKFYGTSAYSLVEGTSEFTLPRLGETYTITMPDVAVRSLILFTSYLEQNGELTVRCNQTGYYMSVEFKKAKKYKIKGFIASISKDNPNKAKKIYKIAGTMTGTIEISPVREESKKEIFVDTNNIQTCKRIVKPVTEQGSYESQRVWHGVRYAILNNNSDDAQLHKTELEVDQRKVRKEREESGKPYEPKFFKKLNDRIAGPDTPYYQYRNRWNGKDE